MSEFIKDIDFIGSSVQFKFKGKNKNQTFLGGMLSLMTLIIIITDLLVGLWTLFSKSNPISYLSTQKADLLQINFSNNIPLMFTIVNRFVELYPDQDKLFSMSGLGLNTIFNKTLNSYQHEIFTVQIEKCDKNYIKRNFGQYSNYFLDNLRENYSYCVPLNQTNYWVSGIYGQTPFRFIDLYVDYCNNKTTNGSCYPMEFIKKTLNSFYIMVNMPDFYFDHSNYDNPGVYNVISRVYPLSASIYNRYFQVMKSVNYLTDNGLFFDNHINQVYFQQKSVNIFSSLEYLSGTNQSIGGVSFGMDTNIFDVYYRSYKKLQTIFAELGGSFNVVFYICLIINYHFDSISKDKEVFDICCDEQIEKQFSLKKIIQKKKHNFQIIPIQKKPTFLNSEKEKELKSFDTFSFKKNSGQDESELKLEHYKNSLMKCILFDLKDIDQIIKTEIRFPDYFRCLRKNPLVLRKLSVIQLFSNQIFDIGFIFRIVLESHVYFSKINTKKYY